MKPDLIIETASGKCPVFTGEHILGDALDALYREASSDLIFLLVDEQVFIHHRERLTETFTERFEQVEIMPVPSGEKSKSVHFWEKSVQFLLDRKSTRLNSSHVASSYAVCCLKKNTRGNAWRQDTPTCSSG